MTTQEVSELWERFHREIWRFIRARVASDADADDLLQDVFVKLMARGDMVRDEERIAGWLFRVASNAIADHHRATRPVCAPRVDGHARDEEPNTSHLELSHCVVPFVEMLDEPYREALRLTEIQGLTQVEAASRAGISTSGMTSRVQRGRLMLRGLIEGCCRVETDVRGQVIDFDPHPSAA